MSDYEDSKTAGAMSAPGDETEYHSESDASTISEKIEKDKPAKSRGGGRKKGLKRTLETYENALSLADTVIAGEASKETCKSLVEHIVALGKSLVKKPKDDSKPKRPPSAWNLFMTTVSKEIKDKSGKYWELVSDAYERMLSDGVSKKGLQMKAISEVFGEHGDHRDVFDEFVCEKKEFIDAEKARYDEQMKELGYDVKHREKGGKRAKILHDVLDEIYTGGDSEERLRMQKLVDESNKRYNEDVARRRAETKIRKAEEEARAKAGAGAGAGDGDGDGDGDGEAEASAGAGKEVKETKVKAKAKESKAKESKVKEGKESKVKEGKEAGKESKVKEGKESKVKEGKEEGKVVKAKKVKAVETDETEETEVVKPKKTVKKRETKLMLLPMNKAKTVVAESDEIGQHIWKVSDLPGWKEGEKYDISSIKPSHIMTLIDGKKKAISLEA